MPSPRLPFLLVVLALTVLGSLGWLTRHPDAALLRWAEQRPVLGPVAERFRAGYQGNTAREPEEAEEIVEWRRSEVELITPPSPPWKGIAEYVWALPGTVIRAAPSGHAEAVHRLDAITNLARLERRGDWFRVWYRGLEGWVYLPDQGLDGEPPLGNDPDPPLPLEPRPPDPNRLALARRLLGAAEHQRPLGEYQLFTDIADPELFDRLEVIARQLEPIYRLRYDLSAKGSPRAAVVIYRERSSLEALQAAEGLEGLPAAGHAARGVAALFLGGRPRHEMTSTLVHELVHLINRRALGPALPPWLDEGLCDDMANLEIDPSGTIDPSRLGGRRLDWGDQITAEGAQASLQLTAEAAAQGSLPLLQELVALDWDGFVRSPRRRLNYDTSALFVRFLVSGEHTAGFQGFLRATSQGEAITAESLSQHLGAPWPDLQSSFSHWLISQSQAIRNAR